MNSTAVSTQVTLLGQMIINLKLFQSSYLSIILLSTGTIGNLISIVVYSRKTFRETAMGKYLIAQSISDLVFQSFAIHHYLIKIFNQIGCQIVWSINVGGMICNSLMKTAVSLDRLILVKFPTKFYFIKKTWFQIAVIVALFSVAWIPIIVAQSFIKYDTIRNNVRLCYVAVDPISQASISVTRWSNLYVGHLVPFITMTICGAIIIKKVFEMKSKSKKKSSKSGRERILAIYTIFGITYFLFMSLVYIGVLIYQIYIYNPRVFNEPYIFTIELGQIFKNIEINTSFFLYLFFNKLYSSELVLILQKILNIITFGRYMVIQNQNGEGSKLKTISTL